MTAEARPLPLLVIEDNPADFETISVLLKGSAFKSPILHCQTGEEALDFMLEQQQLLPHQRRLPAHILLDLNLPGLSGFEVLHEFRHDSLFQVIPVTILTTSSNPRDIIACYQAGANSFLTKPVNFERFETMLRSFASYWFQIAGIPQLGGRLA